MSVRALAAGLAAVAFLMACGDPPAGPAPMPSPSQRPVHLGSAQRTLADPTTPARGWQLATATTRPGGVVVIGIDDVALRSSDHSAIPGTLALAREARAWGRTVIYLTTNPFPTHVQVYLDRAGFPAGELWTPTTAPQCGPATSDTRFRVACITYLAHTQTVVLWLTRGEQLPTPAMRTYAFG